MSATQEPVPPSRDRAAAGREQPPEATPGPGDADEQPTEELVVEELLVEDISIDGMCGVY